MTRLRLTVAAIAALLLLGIGVALSQSITTTSDVQIVARKLEDGRIEFGLEQDGERILPRTRFFPSDAPVDRWLKSSEIAVDAGEESVTDTVEDAASDIGYVAGWGTDVAFINLPEGFYRCTFTLEGNASQYGNAAFFSVSLGTVTFAYDVAASGSWTKTYEAVDGTGTYHLVETEAEQGASWTMSCQEIR